MYKKCITICATFMFALLTLSAQDLKPTIGGFINMQYDADLQEGDNSFKIRRARLDIKGDISSLIDYRFQVEFVSPKLIDGYMRFKIDKAFNVEVGQFKIPFTLESTMGPQSWEAIETSQAFKWLAGNSDITGFQPNLGNGRDIGIMFYGSFLPQDGYNTIDYSVAVVNGEGINTSDKNKDKDIVGKIEVRPIKEVTLSGSIYKGSLYDNFGNKWAKDRYAISARYDDGSILFRTEYLLGTTGATGSAIDSDAFYAVAGYTFENQLMPFFRYDTYRKDKSISDSASTFYTVGLSYFPWENIRFMLNYTHKTKGTNAIGDVLSGMVTFVF